MRHATYRRGRHLLFDGIKRRATPNCPPPGEAREAWKNGSRAGAGVDRAEGTWLVSAEIMKRSFAAALGCVLLWAVPASADAEAPRTRALALIQKLEANTAAKQLLSTTLSEAKQALVRADRARKAGDHQNGAALETLALEWAELAGELERTAAAERAASELEKKRSELENKLDRTRMLIEQLNAQRARTEAELVKLQAEKAPAPPTSAAPATLKGAPGPATTASTAPASTSKTPAKATAPKTTAVPKAPPAPASKEKP
jgi:hypothetical protein